jgi:hypothetical protein
MFNLSVKDLVKNKRVYFKFYRDRALWYEVREDNFVFPVPIEDIGIATMLPDDKALLYMRWIRKQAASIQKTISEMND